MTMLTIQECRQFLDTKANQSLNDSEVEAVRNDLYALARIILSTKQDRNRNENNYGK